MKTHSKWITAVAAFGLTASLAFAGTNGNGQGFEGRHHHHGFEKKLASKLNLTDAQKQQWKDIRKSSHEQNAAFFQQFRDTMKQAHEARQAGDTAKLDSLKPAMQSDRAQMKQIRANQEQQFVSILTPDQRAQYDAIKAKRAARRAEHQASRNANGK